VLGRRTKTVIGLVAALALVGVGASWLAQPGPRTLAAGLGFVLLLLLFLLAERAGVPLSWRGQRVTASFTEPVVLAGLFWFPAAPLVVAAALARLASASIERRPPHKVLFNAAQIALAASVALLVARAAPAPPLVAAILGTAAFTIVVDAATVLVVASVEPGSWRRALRERFLGVAAVEIVFGLSVGLAIVGLEIVHPLAPLVLAPLLWILLRHARMQAKLARESGLHRRLAREQRRLIGIQDDQLIADAILEACHDILQVGRARIRLASGEAWTRAWDAPEDDAPAEMAIPLSGVDGAAKGRLEAWRRPGKPRFEKEDESLLLQLAAQAETAFANAQTLREANAQRVILARQERLSTLGTLVAGVAHEVNNPLTYLRGNLELALMDLDDVENGDAGPERLPDVARQLRTALQGAGRIGEIVQSLRAVARQRPSDEREQVSLNKLVEDVATVIAAGLPSALRLTVETTPGSPSILAHPTDLHQVLLNLAKNGIEAIGEKPGDLVLRVHAAPAAFVLEVTDTGPGIPPAVQAKMFTPFFTTKGAHGTGLGLAIVHGIVKDLGGSIRLHSTPGVGTSFFVTLPRDGAAPPPAGAEPAVAAGVAILPRAPR
jgi:signal transduction histidine kinase